MRVGPKPVVVSVGDMAASGGTTSPPGSVIVADEASIIGSIGVVGGKISAGHALEGLGVHGETVGAGWRRMRVTPHCVESPLVAWDDATRTRVLAMMVDVYDLS